MHRGNMHCASEKEDGVMNLLTILLSVCGGFAVWLGVLRFTFPERFGFFAVLPKDGTAVRLSGFCLIATPAPGGRGWGRADFHPALPSPTEALRYLRSI